ncbi:alkene reductase [Pseudanabaena mucicola]|uniref:Alkene reductase n=1 Tax=Pseudanabaena mucicola FACHB-723 TaxID=2692860 RepID=A0ABR7ZV31_9CYAN|nr:alkene reductase [Pseudanabaena mucicola]MBD2187374.1 alkene reductase [Pseudanabaena mucicola FACHB-723]
MSAPLLSPVKLGRYTLPNRVVLAPLTRNRAGDGLAPTALNALHYAQRASGGLLITEASQISPQGMGYPNTPGIYSDEQVAGWRLVTDAVHAKGGKIFLQLWHVGRISHPDLQPNGELPVAPSAIAPEGEAATYTGMKPFVTPRALETSDIPQIVEQYRLGAKNAIAAGFDGVEIHGANGYLIDQFLQDNTNQRTDIYGGSLENRTRFLMEVTEAVVQECGSDRVGVRLSPSGTFNSMYDSNRAATFSYAVKELNRFDLAYLHLVAPRVEGFGTAEDQPDLGAEFFRPIYNGTIMTAGGYTLETGNAAIASGNADLVAFGRLYIANPDLVERFAINAPLNTPDRNTFYGGDEKGYTDYPTLS